MREEWYILFVQAEDGIRDAQESRGLGDVYKRQCEKRFFSHAIDEDVGLGIQKDGMTNRI